MMLCELWDHSVSSLLNYNQSCTFLMKARSDDVVQLLPRSSSQLPGEEDYYYPHVTGEESDR